MMKRLACCLPFFACTFLLFGCGAPPAAEPTASVETEQVEDPSSEQEPVVSKESKVLVLTEETFQDAVSGNEVVLVDFWAPWCGPCRLIGPVIDEMAEEQAAGASYAKINVDDAPGISSQYEIRSIPALLIFKNGEEVDRLIGVQPRRKIEAALRAAS